MSNDWPHSKFLKTSRDPAALSIPAPSHSTRAARAQTTASATRIHTCTFPPTRASSVFAAGPAVLAVCGFVVVVIIIEPM
jgi:hypothetical protein